MDPLDPTSFIHKSAKLSTGRTYHYVDQLPASYNSAKTITLLLVHGFPDLWYGWRYQIGPWVRAGYRVIAPSMLGYGGTDKPEDPEEYNYSKLSHDLAALLDVVGVPKAIVIGHDWGALTASRFALWHPDRLLALVLIAVPFLPPAKVYTPLEKVVEVVPDLGYQLYFADRKADTEIYNALPLFVPLLHRKPGQISIKFTRPGQMESIINGETPLDLQDIQAASFLNEKERDFYVSEYSKAKSMNGPLNYYRLWKLRFDDEKDLPITVASDLPVLTLHGSKDPTGVPAWLETEKKLIPQLQTTIFDGVSHWIQIEMKEVLIEKVLEFVGRVIEPQKNDPSHL